MFTCALKFFNVLKNQKKTKQKVEKKEYSKTRRSRNIEEKIFVIFEIYLKQSKNEKKNS